MSKKPISISTKTGDDGTSGLISGQRLAKDALIFSAIGSIDELNSWLGLLVVNLDESFSLQKKQLLDIQEQLFYLGADLAGSKSTHFSKQSLARLEKYAQKLQIALSDNWHNKFLFPGGSQLGAYCDIARTVCRRSERVLVALDHKQKQAKAVMKYINRLSDYLYLLRCYANEQTSIREKKFISKR